MRGSSLYKFAGKSEDFIIAAILEHEGSLTGRAQDLSAHDFGTRDGVANEHAKEFAKYHGLPGDAHWIAPDIIVQRGAHTVLFQVRTPTLENWESGNVVITDEDIEKALVWSAAIPVYFLAHPGMRVCRAEMVTTDYRDCARWADWPTRLTDVLP